MTIFKRNIFLLILFFISSFSVAQQGGKQILEDQYRAVHWDVSTGLAHDKTFCMLKDVYGFLWIGTGGGLSRFDGSTFKNYFYDPGKKETIAGVKVWGLVEDSLHNIWIGTDKGLSRYDIRADTLTNFRSTLTPSVISSFIVPFSATKEEVYCCEADSFVTAYNIHSLKKRILIKLTRNDSLPDGDSYSRQYSIFDASSNSVWMLSFSGNTALINISLSTGKRERYGWPGNINYYAETMRYDRVRNSIWLNTDGGLFEFSLNDRRVHQMERQCKAHLGLDIDNKSKIWFNTYSNGICIYDPQDESVHPVFEKDSVLQKTISVWNSCIYCDRDGMVWLGFYLRRGVYQVTGISKVVGIYNTGLSCSRGLRTNDIYNVVGGKRDEMWIGGGGWSGMNAGLISFNIPKDTFTTFTEKNLPGFKGKVIIPIYVDTVHKKAWLAEGENLNHTYEMEIDTRKCKAIVFMDSANHVISPQVSTLPVHYKDGCVVAAAYNKRQCIFIINSDSAVAKQVLSFPWGTINYELPNPTPVSDHLLFLRRSDALGNLTYADASGKWKRIASPVDSISWTIIKYNQADSSFWVVIPRQVIHYDHQFRLMKKYNAENGLPHDEIYGLLPDNLGNIWFNTNRSIYQLNTRTGQVSVLSEKDGFLPSDFRDMGEGIAKDDNGDLYFTTAGAFDGFRKISPAGFTSPQSSVYIKSLEIKDFSLPAASGANNVQQLTLKYFQNRINIETGTVDFYSRGKNRVRYRLEQNGKTVNWQYAPANYTIRYEELQPGKYELQIQASNAGNEFMGPIKTLVFAISPAFWNTWWFRIGAAILVLGAFYVLARYRTQQRFRLRLERSRKEKQIAELGQKTAQLQQQKIEMEMQALRAQMNPHFIFNSLNSINRFILQNNKAQASEYLTKFSKLVRMILQNSQASLISLEAELEALDLYLEMEALRFNYHFDYKVVTSKDLDIEVLQVPPLILQPYVENAIWHGLMHKEEKGHLSIEVLEKDDQLYFSIKDNGIGRQKAKELASKTATKHKSMGLRITANRIAILKKNGSTESPVTIRDLVDSYGAAAGTEVIIKMPLLYD